MSPSLKNTVVLLMVYEATMLPISINKAKK
jgi:hypothetical protein